MKNQKHHFLMKALAEPAAQSASWCYSSASGLPKVLELSYVRPSLQRVHGGNSECHQGCLPFGAAVLLRPAACRVTCHSRWQCPGELETGNIWKAGGILYISDSPGSILDSNPTAYRFRTSRHSGFCVAVPPAFRRSGCSSFFLCSSQTHQLQGLQNRRHSLKLAGRLLGTVQETRSNQTGNVGICHVRKPEGRL